MTLESRLENPYEKITKGFRARKLDITKWTKKEDESLVIEVTREGRPEYPVNVPVSTNLIERLRERGPNPGAIDAVASLAGAALVFLVQSINKTEPEDTEE